MIYRLSLSQRLTLVFTAIMLICAVAVSAVQIRSSKQYGDAMVQRLSLALASKIVESEPLIDSSGQVNRQTLKGLFNHLMTLNPSVELYLVSPSGELLADAAPPGHLQRQKISVQPIKAFLNSNELPVYGNDPRSSQQKVFSAAPVLFNGELHGYLYIILQGEDLNMLANNAWQKNALEHRGRDVNSGFIRWCNRGVPGVAMGDESGEKADRSGGQTGTGQY